LEWFFGFEQIMEAKDCSEGGDNLSPRLQAYINVIQSLLSCPLGQESEILQANQDLIDADFLNLLDQFAEQSEKAGEVDVANFLRELAKSLKEAIASIMSQRIPAYQELVRALLVCPQGEEEKLLASHQDLLDRGLIEVMGQTAGSLVVNGQGDAANFLLAIAEQLVDGKSQLDAQVQQNLNIETAKVAEAAKIDDTLIANVNEETGIQPQAQDKNSETSSFIASKIKDFMGIFRHKSKSSNPVPQSVQTSDLSDPDLSSELITQRLENQVPKISESDNHQGDKDEQIADLPKNEPPPYLLMRLLQTTKDSQGKPQTVFPIVKANIELLDLDFVKAISQWAQQTLDAVPSELAVDIAKDLVQLGTLFLRCPLTETQGQVGIFLEIAIACYQAALPQINTDSAPLPWAAIQNNLAIAYCDRTAGIKLDNLEAAIACYRHALEIYTVTDFPEDWAMTQNNLALVYRDRLMGNRVDNLNRAIVIYQSLFTVYTQAKFPELWALVQMNLAQTYAQLADIQASARDAQDFFNLAINHYQQALQIYQRQSFPKQWTNIQQQLESIYQQQKKQQQENTLTITSHALQLDQQLIYSHDLVPLLRRYNLLPSLVKELIIDQAIATVECTENESSQALLAFEQQFSESSDRALWLNQHLLTEETLPQWATRSLRIEKYKYQAFNNILLSHFLKRKPDLDRVTYRIIRHKDSDIIQELFFRLQSQEQTFEQLVKDFSQVEEGQGDGLIGPVHVGSLHPSLTKALFSISPSEILPPFQIGEWFIILRLEQLIPVRLDEPMREFLLEELFQNWLQQKIGSLLEV